VFMILNQLGIAQTIVNATYIALIGAVALGSALAFGLGGRDAAKDLIDSGYRRAQEQSDQVRADLQTGQQRGQADAQRAAQYAPDGRGGRADAGGTRGGAHEAGTAPSNARTATAGADGTSGRRRGR
jgi:hypothetical protein